MILQVGEATILITVPLRLAPTCIPSMEGRHFAQKNDGVVNAENANLIPVRVFTPPKIRKIAKLCPLP
jgi:hypothetical protein